MTTLIGIRTNSGVDAIVLASDYQITSFDNNGKETSISPERKLYIGDSWVIGYSGISRRTVKRFCSSRKDHRENIEKAISEQDFAEIMLLNKRLRKDGVNQEDLPCFIFASNKPKLKLWWIDEYGNIKDPEDENAFEYICLGGGEEEADKYIQTALNERKIDNEKIDLGNAVKTTRGAILAASNQPKAGTGLGYDLVIMTRDKIESYGDDIRKARDEAEERRLNEIISKYSLKTA